MKRLALVAPMLVVACASGAASTSQRNPMSSPPAAMTSPSEAGGDQRVREIVDSVCPDYYDLVRSASYPAEAIAQGVFEGSAEVRFTIEADGTTSNLRSASASHTAFAAASTELSAKLQCRSIGQKIDVTLPFRFRAQ